ncbi:hypothetical protein C0992_005779, partial [Termitomyces sp. T32_za158]
MTKTDAIKSDLDGKYQRDSIANYIILLGDIEEKERDREKRADRQEEAEARFVRSRRESERHEAIEPIGDEPKCRENDPRQAQNRGIREDVPEEAIEDGESERESAGTSESEAHQLPSKKRKIYESDLPWFSEEKLARKEEDSRCRENRRLLQLYTLNPSKSISPSRISHLALCNFPGSEWDKLIKGELADFDAVYSSIHYVRAPWKNRGRIGDHEIIFGHSDPMRKVEDHGQWTITANLYGEALCFTWPNHRS